MAISKQESFDLYKKMYLTRKSEEAIQKFYNENEMKTPMHMSMGEEAIVVGIIQALGEDSQAFGTYRSHALHLAKSNDVDGFFAEMYGKETGHAKGKAGSMHLSSPKDGLLGTSAIVATTIPVAVGCALANVYKGDKRKVVVFFGDGATDEGVFWESINFACLKKLPIFFICEDNGLAIHTSKKARRGYPNDLYDIISEYDCYTLKMKTTDCEEIYEETKSLSEMQDRLVMKPVFMELSYYRYLEHVGIDEDFKFGYRGREESVEWLKNDPVALQRKRLVEKEGEDAVNLLESLIDTKIERAVNKAKAAKAAGKEELFTDVYA